MPRMTDDQFEQWTQVARLSEEGKAVVAYIRSSPPSRRPRSGVGNAPGFFPSIKMRFGVWFESRTVEKLGALQEYEHQTEVLEYYFQPPSIKLRYDHRESGKRLGVPHVPDFFVIRRASAGWEEWKPEATLVELANQSPNRYSHEQGKWKCPPGTAHATPLGCYYALRSSAELNPILHRNLEYLASYYRPNCPAVTAEVQEEILGVVRERPGITLRELIRSLKKGASGDINRCLVARAIYADLEAVPLADQERVQLFKDQKTSQAYKLTSSSAPFFSYEAPSLVDLSVGQSVIWDGVPWRIVNCGQTNITLAAGNQSMVELSRSQVENCLKRGTLTGMSSAVVSRVTVEVEARLSKASVRDLEEANHRYAVIAHRVKPGAAPLKGDATPKRTIRAWTKQYQEAAQAYGNGYLGLISRNEQKGNRTARVSEAVLEILAEKKKAYLHPTRKYRKAIHRAIVAACTKKGISPPSYDWVRSTLNLIPKDEATNAREGTKAGYKYKAPYDPSAANTVPHGDLPFDVCHLDHTKLDIELVDDETGQVLERPWLTLLFDAKCRRVLAAYLSFDPPSYVSCMMVMRICVKRHARLPRTVVVDGGKEFQSVSFETFLHYHWVEKLCRPPNEPRYGSPQERYFGTTNQTFLYNLPGNTQNSKVARQTTKAVNPKTHASWPPLEFFRRLCEWFYEIYDTTSHPDLCESPRAAFDRLIVSGGSRPNLRIAYDDVFYILSLPTTRKGTAKIQPGRGIKVRRLYYWANELHKHVGKVVAIRYDPFNRGVAYAYVGDAKTGWCWIRCVSGFYTRFAGRTEVELRIASEVHTARLAVHDRNREVSEENLARWLAEVDAESDQHVAMLCQRQQRKLVAAMEIAAPGKGDESVVGETPDILDGEPNRVSRPTQGGPHLKLVEASPETYGDY